MMVMKMRKGVIMESVVVGMTTFGIGTALMFIPSKTLEDNKAWPFVGTFLVGFLAHLGYEVLGLNEWFCENRM
jgi:hypothetical protein|tara:strand:- start:589 stop:807 length:219 start_codon:yes stop_codon:yes gene_type:complete